jgi:hypothetical protein
VVTRPRWTTRKCRKLRGRLGRAAPASSPAPSCNSLGCPPLLVWILDCPCADRTHSWSGLEADRNRSSQSGAGCRIAVGARARPSRSGCRRSRASPWPAAPLDRDALGRSRGGRRASCLLHRAVVAERRRAARPRSASATPKRCADASCTRCCGALQLRVSTAELDRLRPSPCERAGGRMGRPHRHAFLPQTLRDDLGPHREQGSPADAGDGGASFATGARAARACRFCSFRLATVARWAQLADARSPDAVEQTVNVLLARGV